MSEGLTGDPSMSERIPRVKFPDTLLLRLCEPCCGCHPAGRPSCSGSAPWQESVRIHNNTAWGTETHFVRDSPLCKTNQTRKVVHSKATVLVTFLADEA